MKKLLLFFISLVMIKIINAKKCKVGNIFSYVERKCPISPLSLPITKEELEDSIEMAFRVYPKPVACVERALTLFVLMRITRIPGAVVVGVTHHSGLLFHTWARYNDYILVDSADEVSRYKVICEFKTLERLVGDIPCSVFTNVME